MVKYRVPLSCGAAGEGGAALLRLWPTPHDRSHDGDTPQKLWAPRHPDSLRKMVVDHRAIIQVVLIIVLIQFVFTPLRKNTF